MSTKRVSSRDSASVTRTRDSSPACFCAGACGALGTAPVGPTALWVMLPPPSGRPSSWLRGVARLPPLLWRHRARPRCARTPSPRCGRPGSAPPAGPRTRPRWPGLAASGLPGSGRSPERAPTSTPRVGSSTMSRRGSGASHLASRTFCWLPPESFSSSCWVDGVEMFRSLMYRLAMSSMAWRDRTPFRETLPNTVAAMFWATECPRKRPATLRSSGIIPMPALTASQGPPKLTSWPCRRTTPDSRLRTPKMAWQASERPEPTSPERQMSSPARTLKETSSTTGRAARCSTSSTTSPGVTASPRWKRTSRPTMRRMSSSWVVAATSRVPVTAPSLRTVTRSQSWKISARRWLM